MKNTILAISLLMSIALLSCKGKKSSSATANEQSTEVGKQGSAASSATMTITALPDSAILGKKNEVVMRVKNLKALTLSDPDGKTKGTEFTYDIEATNKNAIGGPSVFINPQDFRLELDNGTKISNESYHSFSVDAESTGSSADNKFKLDPGAKPVALDLFYDETRAVIKLNVK